MLNNVLPEPVNGSGESEDEIDMNYALKAVNSYMEDIRESEVPPYGKRHNWRPTSQKDFLDGGAYPEVNMAQFPHNMGLNNKKKSNVVPISLDKNGKIRYDALLRRTDDDRKKVIHCTLNSVLPMGMKNDDELEDMTKPGEYEAERVTKETREALEMEVADRMAATMPSMMAKSIKPPQYIRYTSVQTCNENFNSGVNQRLIKMVEKQRDPMSPPRFRINAKVPKAPSSPPAPVMHSPPRKVTVQEQNDWKIPPCISSWKNPRGYVIPLDKRLATDGRGLHDTHINDKFAQFAEALHVADRKAREAVEMRSQMEKKLMQKEKEEQEDKLRELAKRTNEQRKEINHTGFKEDDEVERDYMRRERHRERERERRIARASSNKKSLSGLNKDRDISEKIALGVPNVGVSHEALFDQRLFNQTQGLDTGFQGGDDEVYNVYDKPWRKTDIQNIYRPSKDLETDVYGNDEESIIKTSRFVNDKGLFGANESASSRQGPVQFQKAQEDDPFQLDEFLSEAKKGKNTREEYKEKHSRKRK